MNDDVLKAVRKISETLLAINKWQGRMTHHILELKERLAHLETLLKIDEAITLSGEKDIYKDGLV